MANGDPTGSAICSVTVDVNGGGVFGTAFDVTTNLEAGKQYVIVVSSTGFNISNYLRWSQYVGNGYAGGLRLYSTDSGSNWSQAPTRDMLFALYDGPFPVPSYLKDYYTATGSVLNIYGTIYIGQSFTPVTSYTPTHIDLQLGAIGNPTGTVTLAIHKVEGESYTEPPVKTTNPTPTNAATDVTLDQTTITWEDGGGADTFDVYYGTVSGSLTKVSSAQAGVSFTVTGITDGSPYGHLVTRYWRIDSTNAGGTTTGDEWSFTTIRHRPPAVTHFYPAGGYYYQFLVQPDGSYGDAPGVGVENTDYVIVAYLPNFIRTKRKMVAVANNKVWIEDI